MANSAKPRPRRTLRYWLLQIHLWTGLILCLPLVLLGITGSLLVYGHDLVSLFGGTAPQASASGEWHPPGAIVAAAMAGAEPGRIPMALRMPLEPGEPAPENGRATCRERGGLYVDISGGAVYLKIKSQFIV